MAALECDCAVQVVSAFSDESLCSLKLPGSGTVLDVKRHVQATLGINVFRQRLIISPAGPEVEDDDVLAALPGPGLRLQLIRLEYADGDTDEVDDLLRAAEEGAAPEVKRLLRLPLQPDCSRGFDRDTPPECWLECSQVEKGSTPLMLASSNGHLEVVQLLCEAGADKDKVDHDDATALIWASGNGHLEVVRVLCQAEADKDKEDESGDTALMRASAFGRLEVVRLLCEAGADKDKADEDGTTALIQASSKGHLDVARLLCEAGADKDKASQRSATALMLASLTGHLEVARLLCEAGADKDKVDYDDATALMYASQGGHLEVKIDILIIY